MQGVLYLINSFKISGIILRSFFDGLIAVGDAADVDDFPFPGRTGKLLLKLFDDIGFDVDGVKEIIIGHVVLGIQGETVFALVRAAAIDIQIPAIRQSAAV